MDVSFLWSWLTPEQWSALTQAILIGVALTEVVKRGARIGGYDVPRLALWCGSIVVTTFAAALHTLRATGAESLDQVTFQQQLDIILFAAMVGPLAPFGHWLVLLKGADFLSWAIEKRTGYQVNLREVAAGTTYRLKRVRKKDGTEELRPEDAPTDHAAGEHTVMKDRTTPGGGSESSN